MKVAVVHDWLTGMRGGERVLEQILQVYPEADIFSLFHLPGSVSAEIEAHSIRTSFLQCFPGLRRHYRWLLPLFPLAVEGFDLAGYDLVLSSSHCVALGARTGPETTHLCYCHTPMRYIYDHYSSYFPPETAWPKRWIIAQVAHRLRIWDATAGRRVDRFVANSRTVADRIKKYYGAESEVIHPSVNTDFFTPQGEPEDGFLVVSAGAPYKRVDLAVRACRMLGFPLTVVGWGPEIPRWQRLAEGQASFVGAISDEELRGQYRRSRGLIFPAHEDFGITPLESMACGRPVIAFGRGGATETVVQGRTGLFFQEQTVESLVQALREFQETAFDPGECRARALEFGQKRFRTELARAVETALNRDGDTP